MKHIYRSYLAIIATVAIGLPIAAFADNQKGEEKKEGKGGGGGHGHSGNGPVVQEGSPRVSVPRPGKVHGNGGSRGGEQGGATISARVRGASVSSGAGRQSAHVTEASPRFGGSSTRLQRTESAVATAPRQRAHSQTRADEGRYTQSNNYGGLWFAPNTHSDWNRGQEHYYKNHNYRWYNNGWLIIDSGYSPSYSSRSSIASSVQAS